MSFKDYPQIILSAKNFQRIDEIIEKHAENLHEILNKEFAWKASSHDPFIRFLQMRIFLITSMSVLRQNFSTTF